MSQEHSNDVVTEQDRLVARRTLEAASLQFSSLRCPVRDPNELPEMLLSILQRGSKDKSDIERWRTWNDITALLAYSAPRDRRLEDTGLLDALATLSRVHAFGLTEWAEDSVPAVSLTIDDGIEVPDTDGGVREQLEPVLAEHYPEVYPSNKRSSASQLSRYLPQSLFDASWLSAAPRPVSALFGPVHSFMTLCSEWAQRASTNATERKSNSAADFQPPEGQFNRSEFLDAVEGVWVNINAAQICSWPMPNGGPTEEQLRSVAAGGSIPTLHEMGLSL